MALVYFLLVPSALIASELLKSSGGDTAMPAERVLLSNYAVFAQAAIILLVTAMLFGTAARWFASFLQNKENEESGNAADQNRYGWMLHRSSQVQFLVWGWCAVQPMVLIASGWISVASSSRLLSHLLQYHSVKILYLALPTAIVMAAINLGQEFTVAHLYNREQNIWLRYKFWWSRRVRFAAHTWMIPIVICVLVCGMVDASQLTKVFFPETTDNQSLMVLMTFLIGTMLFAPQLMSMFLRTEALDHDTERMVQWIWRAGSRQALNVRCWKTGNRVSNAAVIGMLGYGRKLLLTDLLLKKLDRHELQMVILHELAHCVRYHAWIRTIPTAMTVGVMLYCMNTWQGTTLSVICMGVLALFLSSLVAVCWWTEFDADRTALQLAERIESIDGDGEFDDMKLQGRACASLADIAPEKLSSALQKVYGKKNQGRTSWLHPSCNQRILAIQHARIERSF